MIPRFHRLSVAAALAVLAAADLLHAAAPASAATPAGSNRDIPVILSPFEVDGSGERGYYSANTMAGTRLNSRLEDLASSITVVTKQQIADLAILDLNDLFLYEAGTEGTGTFTDYSFDRNGAPVDNTQLDPSNANRIRGVGPANLSFGNFETSGRVPMDPLNIDSVEISRGPNANIFGLGNAAGTVNLQPANANLTRGRS
jgi:outer membrane receptor protein involved in Fe transport